MIDVWPRQDALANILSESKGSGGSPFNILLDIAIMGAPFPLAGAGLVGDDENGRWIYELCAKHGIDTAALLRSPGAPTSYTDVMTTQKDGRRTFFHARGANAELDVQHFDFSRTTARIFHLGLSAAARSARPAAPGVRHGGGGGAAPGASGGT